MPVGSACDALYFIRPEAATQTFDSVAFSYSAGLFFLCDCRHNIISIAIVQKIHVRK